MKKGLVHIYTGAGKGKTTAAMGLVLRALGHDKKVYILQLLKGSKTGEKTILEQMSGVTFKRTNLRPKFFYQMTEEERKEVRANTKEVWQELLEISKQGEEDKEDKDDYEVIILDEVMGAIKNNIIKVKDVITLIESKSKKIELVLTGRNAAQELIDLADYVTEMKMIKHPYTRSVPARKGIEF